MKNRGIKKTGVCTALAVLLIFTFWKATLGIHSDEAHSIAVGHMIARGCSFFKDTWFYLQMSAVFSAPIIFLYEKIFQSTEGILLFFRMLSILIQTGIACYFFRTFCRQFHAKYVLLAAILFFVYIPDIWGFNYKQEVIWFALLEIIYAYRYYITFKHRYVILLGVSVSASVLVYPTTILQFPLYIALIVVIENKNRKKTGASGQKRLSCTGWWRTPLLLAGVCAVCAALFLGVVFYQTSFREFLYFFPKVFQDDNLNSSFIKKMFHPVIKMAVIGVMVTAIFYASRKLKWIKKLVEKYHIPVVSCILWGAFLTWCYVERRGITWHCVTYAYVPALFLTPELYYIYRRDSGYQDKNDLCFVILGLFEIPTIVLSVCMALASNQGNITCMYGAVISAMALLLLLGYDQGEANGIPAYGEKRVISGSMLVIALLMYLFPVYEQESVRADMDGARTIFSERTLVTEGPAKGIRMGEYNYPHYEQICQAVKENVSEEDALFLVDVGYQASYGYLCCAGKYATYSPQGVIFVDTSEIAVDYFTDNPDREPTVVLVNTECLGMGMQEWLDRSPIGTYLTENQFVMVNETGAYAVLRAD